MKSKIYAYKYQNSVLGCKTNYHQYILNFDKNVDIKFSA